MERATRLELATPSLEGWRSTIELHPHISSSYGRLLGWEDSNLRHTGSKPAVLPLNYIPFLRRSLEQSLEGHSCIPYPPLSYVVLSCKILTKTTS